MLIYDWIAQSPKNLIIAALLGVIGVGALTLTLNAYIVEDTSQPPVWMQREHASDHDMRNRDIELMKQRHGH